MPYLAAAVVLVGLIGAVNLVLAYGIIRRLREHTEQLSQLPAAEPAPDIMLPAGSTPDAFPDPTVVTGETMTAASLSSGSLIGFFSPGCPACKVQAPKFTELAATLPKQHVFVVAVGTEAATRELVASFEPVANVVLEDTGGPLQLAFGVNGFPAMCVTGADGRIAGSSVSVSDLADLIDQVAAGSEQPQPA